MANQAVKLCEALLRSISALDGTPCGLEGLAAAAAAAGPRQKQAFRKFYDLKEDFTDMDIVQKNTWKKLIIELKVPEKLAALCCSDDSRVSHRQHAAVSILNLFLVEASQRDWCTGLLVAGRPVSNLASIFAEQLRQSAFLQEQLPVLLSAAADQLEAAQDEQEMLASTQLSDESRNSLPAPQLRYPALLQRHAADLLTLLVTQGHLLRDLPTAVATAALRLVCAAIQHTCRCLELLPDQTAPRDFITLSSAAVAAAVTLHLYTQSSEDSSSTSSSESSSSTSMPHTVAQQQLQWPIQIKACGTLVLLALCQQHGRKLHRQLKRRSVGSESIWQYACAQHSQLPQPYLQLCQALGYSSRALLYVACSNEVPLSKDNLSDMFATMRHAIQATAELKYSLRQQQRQQQQHQQQQLVQGLSPQRVPPPQQQQQQEQQQEQEQQQANKDTAAEAAALLTLPHLAVVALLHWAASRSPSAAGPQNVTAALELIYYLLDWDTDAMPDWDADPEDNPQGVADSSIRLQQQQQHQAGLTAPQPQSSACDSEESVSEGCQQDTMQWWMTGELLEQALELTSTLVQRFWALLMSGEAAGAAAAAASTGSAGGSASSSGGGDSSCQSATVTSNSSSSTSTSSLLSEAYWALLYATEDLLAQLKLHAEAAHAAELLVLAGSGSQDTQQPTSSISKAWAKHTPLLLRPVEAFARLFPHHEDTPDCIMQMIHLPLEAFVGPEGVLASYWCSGASRDLDPQLISTCFSLLKAVEVCRHMEVDDDQAEVEALARCDALNVVVRMCLASLAAARASDGAKETACAGRSADGTSDRPGSGMCTSSSSSLGNSSSSDSSSGAVSVLPWLVLLGRCCLHLALELQQPDAARGVAVLSSECMGSVISDLIPVQGPVLVWLQDNSNAAELAAAGYDIRRVVAALQALTVPAGVEGLIAAGSDGSESGYNSDADNDSAYDSDASDGSESVYNSDADSDSAYDSDGSESAAAAVSDADVATFAQELHALGLALNTLAISCACNNPLCKSLDGLSELELVQGRARLCAKCRVARYCSKECQAQHWKLHKPACKALEAAQQAQGSASTLSQPACT